MFTVSRAKGLIYFIPALTSNHNMSQILASTSGSSSPILGFFSLPSAVPAPPTSVEPLQPVLCTVAAHGQFADRTSYALKSQKSFLYLSPFFPKGAANINVQVTLDYQGSTQWWDISKANFEIIKQAILTHFPPTATPAPPQITHVFSKKELAFFLLAHDSVDEITYTVPSNYPWTQLAIDGRGCWTFDGKTWTLVTDKQATLSRTDIKLVRL